MEPSSINLEYCENCIHYQRQLNEQIFKEMGEIEERINTAALKLAGMNENLNNIHQTNDELKSKIEQIKTDIHEHDYQSNTLKYISIVFFGLTILTTVSISYCNYQHVNFDGGNSYQY